MARAALPIIPYGIDEIDGIGMLHSDADGTDAIVMVGEGSNLDGMSPSEQKAAVELAAKNIRRMAILQNDRMGVSFVDRRRPVNMAQVRDEVLARIHPDFFIPDGRQLPIPALEGEDRLVVESSRYNDEILDLIKRQGRSVTQAAVMTIKRDHNLDKAFDSARRFDRNVQRRSLVKQLVDTAITGFSDIVQNPRILDYAGLHDYVHDAWNLAGDDYNEARQEGATALVESRLHVPEREIYLGKGYCWVDQTCHAVLEVTDQPKEIIVAEALNRFELPVPYYSYALFSEAISYKSEYGNTSRYRFGRKQLRDKLELIEDVRSEDRDERLDRRTRELYQAQFSQDYVHLIAVSALNLEDLEYFLGEADRHLKLNRMSSRRVMLPAYQLQVLLRATMGV